MGWEISKKFDCCYGHRVHNQTLNKEYSIDNRCVCRHLHGHQMGLEIFLTGDELTAGMVTDFKHLNWLKVWIDDVLDHKFLIDHHDPLYNTLLPDFTERSAANFIHYPNDGGYWKINPEAYKDMPKEKQELYEGYVIVNFVPTSENLAKWIHDLVKSRMDKIGVTVSKVEFMETPKSKACYNGGK